MTRRSMLAWTLCGLAIGALIASIALSLVLDTWGPEDKELLIPLTLGTAAMAVIGTLIASRTGNPIGWLLLSIPVTLWVSQLAADLADYGLPRGASYGRVMYWLSSWPFFASLLLLVAVFYLFPTGNLSSRRWRWPWRVYVSASVVTIVGFALLPYRDARAFPGVVVTNPIGLEALEGILGPALALAGSSLLASCVLAFVSLATRYRRAEAEGRQQLKWLFAVGGLALVTLATWIGFGILAEQRGGIFDPISRVLGAAMATVLGAGIPVAAGVAIFKYHLYDLNLVIRKTVVYGAMAGFVTVVYAAVVVALSRIVGGDSILLSIIATALIAGLFQPVRRAATRFANRLVFGKRAEPYEVLAGFSDRIGGTYAAEDVLPRMARVIGDGVGAELTQVWLGSGDGLHLVASWPAYRETNGDPDRAIVIAHRDEQLGELRVHKPPAEPLTLTEDKLLEDLAAQAGLVLRNVRLTVDLRARVEELSERAEELRASRARIVAAHDAERRRLERNIHDGAQQHLVALAVKLRLASTLAASEPAKAADMLRAIADETKAARTALLDLASGIYPATLEERGMVAALEEQAHAGDIPIVVDGDGVGRLPIETEAAVYFVCLEAIQNAVKYAEASRIEVSLRLEGTNLSFEVADDGRGFDASMAETGSGLRNMRDRLSAFGGDVEIGSSPGRGTWVRGSLPLVGEARR